MKKISNIIVFLFVLLTITGCSYFETGELQNVGMLMEGSVEDSEWNEQGYAGLIKIKEEFDTDVYYKENITTMEEIDTAVQEFINDGVNLIYGNSSMYETYFSELAVLYPDTHFVYFNGGTFLDNLTSVNFDGHAMGFFAGMVAGEMTTTDHVGIIAAHLWQPEIEGFYEGVKYLNAKAEVEINFISSWNDVDAALVEYNRMQEAGADVFYPTSDIFSDAIIQEAADDGHYAFGYVSDQYDLAPETVLTSTIQKVDQIYADTAKQFNNGELAGEIRTFDFQDDYITLGRMNEKIDVLFIRRLEKAIEKYKEDGILPNQALEREF